MGPARSCQLEELPSFYYRRQIFSCFFKDPVGVELLDRVGHRQRHLRDRLPAPGLTWPDSREAAAEQFGHLDQAIIDKIARNNGIELLGLDLPLA